nr:hypothetical protein CFP56_21760 [Quercus suber]
MRRSLRPSIRGSPFSRVSTVRYGIAGVVGATSEAAKPGLTAKDLSMDLRRENLAHQTLIPELDGDTASFQQHEKSVRGRESRMTGQGIVRSQLITKMKLDVGERPSTDDAKRAVNGKVNAST